MSNQTYKKLNRIQREREHAQKYLVSKYPDYRRYKNRNTSVLPLHEWKIFLDEEYNKVILSKNEFIIKINQVSFLGDVGDFATSLDLKI